MSNVPVLIQLLLCSEPFFAVIIVEIHYLRRRNKEEFQLIKNLFNSLFVGENKIFIWDETKELKVFIQFNIFKQ